MRPQAADVCRKLEWKHGNCAIGKIDTSSAHASLLIERRIRSNVVRHIGNVHLELEVAVLESRDQYRIVEVARSLAINGDDRQIAKVAPLAEFGGGDDRLNCLRFREQVSG